MRTASLSSLLSDRATLRRRAALGALGLALAVPAAHVRAQDPVYPSKPIKLVVGYPAGGSVDLIARVVGDGVAARLKGVVVVDNQSGAAGAIAAQRIATSPADGYTLFVGSSNELVATRVVNPAQRYDGRKDFTPISLLATSPLVLVASPRAGVRNLGEFVDAARKNPGKFSYGSSGVGSTLHFAGELFKQRAGVFMTHIPYRGVAPLTNDLAGGSLEIGMLAPPAALPFIQSGRIVPLGVTGAQRLAALPQVPAIGEHPQLKGYELVGWFAMMAPRGLPADVAQRLSAAVQDTLRDPAVRKKLEDAGLLPSTGREDVAALIASETTKYEKLAAVANMKE